MKFIIIIIILITCCINRHIRLSRCPPNPPCFVPLPLPHPSSSTPLCLSLLTVLLQMVFGLPFALRPSGVHPNTVKQSFTPSLLSNCPNQFYLLLCTSQLISFISAISTTLLLVILCCHLILSNHPRHWHWKLFNFLLSVFVIFLSHIAGPVKLKTWIGVSWFSFLFLWLPTPFIASVMQFCTLFQQSLAAGCKIYPFPYPSHHLLVHMLLSLLVFFF